MKLTCWMWCTLLNVVFVLLDVCVAQGAPYAWKAFWIADIFGNEIRGPGPSGLSWEAVFPPGAHRVSVVRHTHTRKWCSSPPLTQSADCVSVSQARGCEDLSQPQVHVHTEDPSIGGSREHCVQLTSGNSDVDLPSPVLESHRRIRSVKASVTR